MVDNQVNGWVFARLRIASHGSTRSHSVDDRSRRPARSGDKDAQAVVLRTTPRPPGCKQTLPPPPVRLFGYRRPKQVTVFLATTGNTNTYTTISPRVIESGNRKVFICVAVSQICTLRARCLSITFCSSYHRLCRALFPALINGYASASGCRLQTGAAYARACASLPAWYASD